jgi:hypothetical protein
MKLNDWAKKAGVKYLTAYRWFKNGTLPVPAYQTDSGTIIVQDNSDALEQNMSANSAGDAMSVFLKKTVEFSKNNSSIEDFAAYVISNFQLKLNGVNDGPKYSKNKPKSEEIQKHFQQFIPDKGREEQLKAIKSHIKEQTKDVTVPMAMSVVINEPLSEEVEGDIDNYQDALADYGSLAEGSVTQSVDLSTPQQINYTGSTNLAFCNNSNTLPTNDATMPTVSTLASGAVYGNTFTDTRSYSGTIGAIGHNGAVDMSAAGGLFFNAQAAAPPFQPTQKELQSAVKVIETADARPRSRRGRKPFNRV